MNNEYGQSSEGAGEEGLQPRREQPSPIDELREDVAGFAKASEHGTAEREKLAKRRESGEISKEDFDLNMLWQMIDNGFPLTKNDVGNQAVVLDNQTFNALGSITILHSSGEEMTIDAESLKWGDIIVIYPEELGE